MKTGSYTTRESRESSPTDLLTAQNRMEANEDIAVHKTIDQIE